MDKKQLRNHIRTLTDALDEEYLINASRKIAENITDSLLFKNSKSIFVFVSTDKEPDTSPIIQKALDAGKKVYVPKCFPDRVMKAIRIKSADELTPGYMGIPEPVGDEEADTLDLSILPCMSASPNGDRLGHGGGYYDRFLASTECKTVCVCFEKLITDNIPTAPHDIRPNIIITEKSNKMP